MSYLSKKSLFRRILHIGLLDINDENKYLGWICPHCKSEFDVNDNIMYIYGEDFDSGKA